MNPRTIETMIKYLETVYKSVGDGIYGGECPVCGRVLGHDKSCGLLEFIQQCKRELKG